MKNKSTGVEKSSQSAANALAKISKDEYAMRKPLLQNLLDRSMSFMDTGNIGESQYYDPIKNTIEAKMTQAKGQAMENLPAGGALKESLSNIFSSGQSDFLNQILTKELGNAYTLGTGGAPIAIEGLGTAAGSMASLASAQAQRASAEGSNANICCFIFIAGHGFLHPIVRKYRDTHMTIKNKRGYYWLSDRLVPLMKKYKIVMKLVKLFMIDPMTSYGKYYYGLNRIGAIFGPIAKMWLILFSILGCRPPYTRKGSSEVV